MHEKSQTEKLLELLYKNTEMGIRTLPEIIGQTESGELRHVLEKQLTRYEQLSSRIRQLLHSVSGRAPQGLNGFERTMAGSMTAIKAMKDDSPHHLADMLIKGASTGISDITEQIGRYPVASPDAQILAEELRDFEQKTIDELQPFLAALR